MTKPPLTVRNAAIATASVEIKTLTVSGKQVTLAVFRQLLEVPLVTDDGTLAGQPWGVVNYHPDKCSAEAEHWHVVWQQGDALRRSAVTTTPRFEEFWPDEGDRFISSCVHDLITLGETPYFDGNPPLDRLLGTGTRITTHADFPATLSLINTGCAAVHAWRDVLKHRKTAADNGDPVSGWWATRLQQAEERFAQTMKPFAAEVSAYNATTDELYQRYSAAVTAEQQRRERHTQTRAELATLPQLFIAV